MVQEYDESLGFGVGTIFAQVGRRAARRPQKPNAPCFAREASAARLRACRESTLLLADARAHVFHRAVQDIKSRNADTIPGELQSLIEKTVREVRAERRIKGKAGEA
jgi:hypothetical protein